MIVAACHAQMERQIAFDVVSVVGVDVSVYGQHNEGHYCSQKQHVGNVFVVLHIFFSLNEPLIKIISKFTGYSFYEKSNNRIIFTMYQRHQCCASQG